ncbi:hypothetical protein PLICRDRAFT_104708 [Plicaturopsis crispa FD-325 SS-3]|nr:hypothetical protein PLICRDRAFT_104708 [Plicaturopsis crispa FD-325 SS-3]
MSQLCESLGNKSLPHAPELAQAVPQEAEHVEKGEVRKPLLGPPTERFRDNLRNDTKYITSWTGAGWTNDVMTYANLIYLGSITERVPVIPKFTRNVVHVEGDIPPIAFGEIFDIPRLSAAVGTPILEWPEVKDEESDHTDELGCWSVWDAVSSEDQARPSDAPIWIGVDISYTRAPSYIKLEPNSPSERFSTFWSLATLSYPDKRNSHLVAPRPSPEHGVMLPPDEQMLCFDYLYYVCAFEAYEFERDYSPAWNHVMRHMHWTERLLQITDTHVRRALQIPRGQPTPPWISIHIRHHDFGYKCGDVPLTDCFAPLSAYARRVREIQQELRERKGLEVTHVLMTSDEKDAGWWAEVDALGWKFIDFEAQETEDLYGPWYPILIDAVIQSMAAGFVGTDGSTMSMIAQRRVYDWHEGVTRNVKWGWVGADDH